MMTRNKITNAADKVKLGELEQFDWSDGKQHAVIGSMGVTRRNDNLNYKEINGTNGSRTIVRILKP